MTRQRLDRAAQQMDGGSDAYIVAAIRPDGEPGLVYQGNLRQLTTLYRLIRDKLREHEGIGNHPRRGDVRASRKATKEQS